MITRLLAYFFDGIEARRLKDEEFYLSQSMDLADLERRQKKLLRRDKNTF